MKLAEYIEHEINQRLKSECEASDDITLEDLENYTKDEYNVANIEERAEEVTEWINNDIDDIVSDIIFDLEDWVADSKAEEDRTEEE